MWLLMVRAYRTCLLMQVWLSGMMAVRKLINGVTLLMTKKSLINVGAYKEEVKRTWRELS
jgi:hypothetical protein